MKHHLTVFFNITKISFHLIFPDSSTIYKFLAHWWHGSPVRPKFPVFMNSYRFLYTVCLLCSGQTTYPPWTGFFFSPHMKSHSYSWWLITNALLSCSFSTQQMVLSSITSIYTLELVNFHRHLGTVYLQAYVNESILTPWTQKYCFPKTCLILTSEINVYFKTY